jgi:uncharacterized membrane protein
LFRCAAKILEFPRKKLKLTAFCSAAATNLGIYQQKQLKLTVFCPAAQRQI